MMADPNQGNPQGRPQTPPNSPAAGQVTTLPANPNPIQGQSSFSALPLPTHEDIVNQLRLTAQDLRAGNWTQGAMDAFTLGVMVFKHFTGTQQAFPRHVMLAQGGGPGTITAAQCAAECDRLADEIERQASQSRQSGAGGGQAQPAALAGLGLNWQQLVMAVVQAVLSSLRQT
jgi:hypothetical protein